MVRVLLVWSLFFTSGLVSAQTTAPGALEQPVPPGLHFEAVEHLRAGRYAEARSVFDKLEKQVPVDQRTRAMVLNRAIADMSSDLTVMRAVRSLNEYLAKHPADDEVATNILAGALHRSAKETRLKRGSVWQSAYAEWERRNASLEASRPGFHRWGVGWLDEEKYVALREDMRAAEQAIREQKARVEDAKRKLDASQLRRAEGAGFIIVDDDPFAPTSIVPRNISQSEREEYDRLRANKATWPLAMQKHSEITRRNWEYEQAQRNREAYKASARYARQRAADEAFAREANAQIDAAMSNWVYEMSLLHAAVALRPRPDWPERFEPVEP